MPRVAIYLRVSTEAQDVANQLPALEQLCDARGWVDREVFTEIESGAKRRPVLDALTARASRGQFSAVVVWALDRLGRSMFEVIDRVRSLDAANVRIASFQEPWVDTGGPVRPLLLAIFAWVADQERARLIERTRAGMEQARRRGRRIGRPTVADPARVHALRAAGHSWRQIAEDLGISTASARRAAARDVTKGPPAAPS